MQVMNKIEGVRLKEKHGGKFHFRFHMTEKMSESPIEALDLSTRAYNCMKRRGFDTIGELVTSIAAGNDIRQTKNLGEKTAREVMEKLFLFQYDSLPVRKREDFIAEVLLMNSRQLLQNEE